MILKCLAREFTLHMDMKCVTKEQQCIKGNYNAMNIKLFGTGNTNTISLYAWKFGGGTTFDAT